MQVSSTLLLDSIPLGIVITDLSGNITDVNQALLKLIGRVSDLVVGCSLKEFTVAEYHTHDQEALLAVSQGMTPAPYIKELLDYNGGAIPVEVHTGAIREGELISRAIFTMKELSQEMRFMQQLQRRNMHLIASSEVSKAATQILDINELLNRCVDLIRSHFGFYYAAIFLIDRDGKDAVLRAATSEAGEKLLENKHALSVGSKSMVGWVTANNTARIAHDVGEEAIRFDNPLLPKTRSEMALPLRVRGEVIGAIDVQSTVINAFSTEDIQTIQMMADQVAIAIDNARLFAQKQGQGEVV